MKRRNFLASCAALALTGCGGSSPPPPPPVTTPDWVLSNGVVTLRASARFGSAIYSIVYNGVELLDSYDHGRLYQSAWQYDGLGEGYNPTEGGSAADAIGPTSSSQIVSAAVTGNVFTATSRPALWQPYGPATGSTLEKELTLNGNLITDVRTFSADADHGLAAIEIITAYMAPSFTEARLLDVSNGVYSDLPLPTGTAASSHLAIVACNPDGSCALGLWSPGNVLMLGQRIAGITKTDIWTSVGMAAGQRYSYRCYAAVGTLAEVAAALTTVV